MMEKFKDWQMQFVNKPKDSVLTTKEVCAKRFKGHPVLAYDAANQEWTISGKSYPKDPLEVYRPLTEWIASLQSRPPERCGILFKLEFFNTVSSHIFVSVLREMKTIKSNRGVTVNLKWFWESGDEDMRESALSLINATGIELEVLEVENFETGTLVTC